VIRAWRLLKARHVADAFTGEGARLYGSRWTSPGLRVVYASQSLSLATLEILVHLQASKPLSAYGMFDVEFPEECVEALDPTTLPTTWRAFPAPPETRTLGDAWLRNGSNAVLRVPSAITPVESNFLLNPEHEDFARFRTRGPRPYRFDSRLLGEVGEEGA
jgi:RES domain-containing protein